MPDKTVVQWVTGLVANTRMRPLVRATIIDLFARANGVPGPAKDGNLTVAPVDGGGAWRIDSNALVATAQPAALAQYITYWPVPAADGKVGITLDAKGSTNELTNGWGLVALRVDDSTMIRAVHRSAPYGWTLQRVINGGAVSLIDSGVEEQAGDRVELDINLPTVTLIVTRANGTVQTFATDLPREFYALISGKPVTAGVRSPRKGASVSPRATTFKWEARA